MRKRARQIAPESAFRSACWQIRDYGKARDGREECYNGIKMISEPIRQHKVRTVLSKLANFTSFDNCTFK